MHRLDDLPPAEHRRRFEALLAAGRARSAAEPVIPPPRPLDPATVVVGETIEGGWYWTTRVPAGMALRLRATAGTGGVATLMWSAAEPTERLNLADTVKVQWSARIGAGRVLLSDMGRAMASITADSGAAHDLLLGGGEGRNRDNFVCAAARFGLGPRDIPPWLSLWADVRVTDSGRFAWFDQSFAEAAVDLRAEMDLLVAVSNAPHAMAPPGERRGEQPPAEATVWRAPAAAADDPCRTSSVEAVRAFANTDRPLRP